VVVWRSIGKYLASSGVMLDVGAHRGESSEIFADFGWRVYCFEPNPDNWHHVEARVTGRYRSARLIKAAVGEFSEKDRIFYTSAESSGISSLHSFHESHSEAFSVDVVSLRDYCAENELFRVDFLKIDTEGFDLFVLRGVDWSAISPKVIVCEFEDSKTVSLGYTYHDMARFLVGLGYRVIVSEWEPVVRYGAKHTWSRYSDYPSELLHADGWGNLIAVKERSIEERVLREIDTLWDGKLGDAQLTIREF
jgi:FkbM family methyltransferase